MSVDPETEERIEKPASVEAGRETRMTPVDAVAQMRIRVPVRANKKLRTVIERVNKDDQVKAWWHVANVNAVARMEINDHSWVHIQIVTNIALKLLRQLTKHHIEPAMVTDYGMTRDDAEVVVALTALTHCVGMSVHRHGHEDFSLFLAEPKLRELLEGIYDEPDLTVVVSEVLQGIISHRADGEPLTVEAGILRVADALDMEQGRSRIAFERGRVGALRGRLTVGRSALDRVVKVRILAPQPPKAAAQAAFSFSAGSERSDGLRNSGVLERRAPLRRQERDEQHAEQVEEEADDGPA